ncbi:MAG: phosphate acyltransferase PlsX [Gammaproteobacteria bacterium]|nr:phosphate acyltransferase PlsX [Gammaproteobacteria bacterium]MDH5630439.1 phosphate acyltransferase PlsX [Gammaproteobacteria bacterium]
MSGVTIAIDCMGGDFGPSVTVPAVGRVLNEYPDTIFRLFGNPAQIKEQLSHLKLSDHGNIRIVESTDDVLMIDPPALALKNKKNSSMRLALESVRDGKANACVSAGNTGALMAISRFVLKMLPGIDRPAIISAIPTLKNDHVYMLDLGANIDCDEHRLTQFAIMGDQLAKSIDQVNSPRVALLNIGSEDNKGSEKIRRAGEIISSLGFINYAGFIEGNEIFNGNHHVIVTDGFTGNNVLKTSEGFSHFLNKKIKDAFKKNLWTKFCGLLAKPVLSAFKHEVNPEKYNGACLMGLRGIVIKSHGGANVNATYYAIKEAIEQSRQKVPQRIREQLEAAKREVNSL